MPAGVQRLSAGGKGKAGESGRHSRTQTQGEAESDTEAETNGEKVATEGEADGETTEAGETSVAIMGRTVSQSYAARVAARPAYAKYKNRKKHLRRMVAAGSIDPEERQRLQDLAYGEYIRNRYRAAQTPEGFTQWVASLGAVFANPREAAGRCNAACWFANKPICKCICEGRFHGGSDRRILGREPLASPPPPPPSPPKPCGTVAAYSRHKRRGEQPCDKCSAAKRLYERRRVAAKRLDSNPYVLLDLAIRDEKRMK